MRNVDTLTDDEFDATHADELQHAFSKRKPLQVHASRVSWEPPQLLEQPCAKAAIRNWQLQTVADPINDHVDFVIIEAFSDLRDETKWWLFLLGGRVAQLEYITSGGARGAGWDLHRIECIKIKRSICLASHYCFGHMFSSFVW